MEQSLDPETQEELRNALETLVTRADRNGVISDTTPFTLRNDDTDTPGYEVIIDRLQE